MESPLTGLINHYIFLNKCARSKKNHRIVAQFPFNNIADSGDYPHPGGCGKKAMPDAIDLDALFYADCTLLIFIMKGATS
jgi:hypothetical protein